MAQAIVIALLMVAHCLSIWLEVPIDTDSAFISQFNLNGEGNIPTFFAATALLVAALAAFCCARTVGADQREGRWGWYVIALLLLFMCLDEAAQIHDSLDGVARQLVVAHGAFFYPWVALYGALVIAILLVLLPFWLRQRGRVRLLLAFGAVIFVGSAIGMEMIEAHLVAKHGDGIYLNPRMAIVSLTEEGGEMLGAALLLQGALAQLASRMERLRIAVL